MSDAILQVAQRLFIGVDHRDFVGRFTRQAVCGGAADLAGAEDHNLHLPTCYMSSSRARLSISHFAPSCSKLTCTRACGPWPSDVEHYAFAKLAMPHPRPEPHCAGAGVGLDAAAGACAPPSVVPSGRASWMRGRSSWSRSGGISWMKREATL